MSSWRLKCLQFWCTSVPQIWTCYSSGSNAASPLTLRTSEHHCQHYSLLWIELACYKCSDLLLECKHNILFLASKLLALAKCLDTKQNLQTTPAVDDKVHFYVAPCELSENDNVVPGLLQFCGGARNLTLTVTWQSPPLHSPNILWQKWSM
jgi:hypothetical protein